jgi:hypothetical protein
MSDLLRNVLFGLRHVEKDGVPVDDAGTLNFAGPGVTAVYDPVTKRIDVTVSGAFATFLALTPGPAPGPPGTGFRLYVDELDNALKVVSAGHQITTLASY